MLVTVKCLTETEKFLLVSAYQQHNMSLVDLANYFSVSARTVGRVLEERDIPSPTAKRNGEQYKVMKLLKQYHMSSDELKDVLYQYKNNKQAAHNNRQAALFKPFHA